MPSNYQTKGKNVEKLKKSSEKLTGTNNVSKNKVTIAKENLTPWV